MSRFTHLHVHTQFSLLDGAASIDGLINKALADGMSSLAITDHGNMYGVLSFVKAAQSAGIKPIIGCEAYVAHNSRFDKKSKDDRSGYHIILLAKNLTGYKNLTKLISLGNKEGFYYTPRIDRELLRKYSDGLIASSACLGGEIPYFISNFGIEKAEERLAEYLDIFKDDFYFELQRHGIEEQKKINSALLELSAKYNVKVIATNDVHFINKDDAEAHNILIRLKTKGEMDDEKKLVYTGNEFLRTTDEMLHVFSDIPEAVFNTMEISDKVEKFSLKHPVVLPEFPLPDGFSSADDYLRHLTIEGAKKKYPDAFSKSEDFISTEISARIEKELSTIKKMGFPGYFLIVEDFIREAKKLGVIVGPGRGSAAGSIVAFCIGITNIDPIKYNLLFERFLNPERVNMPDIDIDFDDEQRDKVLDYVVNKYGKEKVAQIITFGTMGPKLAIRDVARVLEMPLPEADKLAKFVPEVPGLTFKAAYESSPDLVNARDNGSPAVKKVLKLAEVLEGSVRHYGTHACGVIISNEDLSDYVPLCNAKDSQLMVIQYEGKNVEDVGLLKMDFLGLKTLTIIKDAINSIKIRTGNKIDIENIPLDDKLTFELFKKGNTIGIFQFESDGMRTYLKSLKPTNIEDLIAMNALFRPGPMDHIPSFINRKHGKEKINYPHPILEEILKPTYGVMVYQEQIMQISQRMAAFSGSEADELRKAMGKKKKEDIEKLSRKFIMGSVNNNIDQKKAEEIYEMMAKFGQYGFNRSHAAAYSVIAYQTAFLKAHYPADFMAAILTNNINDIKSITFYLSECKRHNIVVLGPDINESNIKFTVNSKGEIRFGLAAVKNVGEGVVSDIIAERETNGYYKDVFDLAKRVNVRSLNKKCLESLVLAGAFDSFPATHRAQYFFRENPEDVFFLEKIIRNASSFQNGKLQNQVSLFGDCLENELPELQLPDCEPWSKFELLQKEKEIVGFFISGHPLDEFSLEMANFCNSSISEIKTSDDLKKIRNREVRFAGIVSASAERFTKKGDKYVSFTIEDYNDSMSFNLFKEDFLKFNHFLLPGQILYFKARIQSRFNADDQYELRISAMCLLSEVIEKYAKSVSVMIPLSDINDDVIGKLNGIVTSSKGNCPFKIIVSDDTENCSIELISSKNKINISDFTKLISRLSDLEFKVS